MHWMYLLIAGIFEISWAVGLKFSHGFSQIIPSIMTVVCMILSFYFLALALKSSINAVPKSGCIKTKATGTITNTIGTKIPFVVSILCNVVELK